MKESLQYKLYIAAQDAIQRMQHPALSLAVNNLRALDNWDLQEDKYLAGFCQQWDNEFLRCSIRKWNVDEKFTFHFYSGDECHSPFFDTFDKCVDGVKRQLLK